MDDQYLMLIPVLALLGLIGVYFAFIRVKMDPKAAKIAREAFEFSAAWLNMPLKGKCPPVILKPAPWKHRGVLVCGTYNRMFRIPFINKYLIEYIEAVDADYLFENLGHETCHCHNARKGITPDETRAELCEQAARTYRLNKVFD